MDAQITDLLDTIGVDQATQARLSLFVDVDGPNRPDVEPAEAQQAFLDPTPVTVNLTAGQIVLLRGGLRYAVEQLLNVHQQKAFVDTMFGADPTEGFLGGGATLAYASYLDCEDVLAGAAAMLAPVEVPDGIPADWL